MEKGYINIKCGWFTIKKGEAGSTFLCLRVLGAQVVFPFLILGNLLLLLLPLLLWSVQGFGSECESGFASPLLHFLLFLFWAFLHHL